jgi:hypothetical protein
MIAGLAIARPLGPVSRQASTDQAAHRTLAAWPLAAYPACLPRRHRPLHHVRGANATDRHARRPAGLRRQARGRGPGAQLARENPGRHQVAARFGRRGWFCCRSRSGASLKVSAVGRLTCRCAPPAAAVATCTRPPSSASCSRRPSGLGWRSRCRRTGCGMRTPTHALDRGAPIHLVQATLGHASVVTTGRYLHARPTDSSARYLAV